MTTEAAQLHPVVAEVTARIVARSSRARAEYLAAIDAARPAAPTRTDLGCSNLAHGFAGCSGEDRLALRGAHKPGVAIVSAYNDMLSAHQPFEVPRRLKRAVRDAGGVAQFAGGVPAMCDGITQGRAGHGAVAVQPRRHRHGDRDRAVPRHVRRRAHARRLRQDRARPADRRAVVRPPARHLRAGRADDLRHAQRREGPRPPAVRRGPGRPARSCSTPSGVLPRRRAPAPSTAPPTPTRC